MPKFRYLAIDAAGNPIRGTVEAATPAAVADRMHGQGCHLLNADELGKTGRLFELLGSDLSFESRLRKAALAQFTRELSVMLAAGQDIDHALRFLAESSDDRRARRVAAALRNDVRGGMALSAALAEHRRVFSRLYVSLVRAGEAGGRLAEGLAHLADLLERESRLSASIQSALAYPILLAVAAIATITLLLTQVLPQFTPIFQQAGAQLPRPTRILMGIGEVARADGGWIALAALSLVLLSYRVVREPAPRLAAERLLLHVPLLGRLIRRAQAARFARTLGTLLRSGVSLIGALAIARGVLGNLLASRLVDAATAEVKAGGRLSAALAAGGFFPAQTIHLLQLGEETGTLAQTALRAADIHDDQVQQSVQRMVSLLVPAVTIIMGLIVAGIVSSLLVAMLSLNDLAT